jgi:CRP-like cAMP-binding protein
MKTDDGSNIASEPGSKRASISQLRAHRIQIHNESEDFFPDENRQLPYFEKTEVTKTFLQQSLQLHYLFESLGREDIDKIVNCMKPTSVPAAELIITQGDIGELFYCLEVGSAVASVEGVGEVCSYEAGGCFGDLALLYNCPRAASVLAVTTCSLWTLDLR